MGEGMNFLDPKIKAGETYRSKLPREDESERKLPDFHIISAHGLNVDSEKGLERKNTARKVEYAVGGATHVLPEVILHGVLERKEYTKKKVRGSRSDGVVSKNDEVGEREGNEFFGRGFLNKLNQVDVSLIGVEGQSEDQNLALRLDFVMQRQHLKELVLAYEKKRAEKLDASRDMQEIISYSKTLSETFSFGEEEDDNSREIKGKKKTRKPRQKKMRLNDENEEGKPVTSKSNQKKGGVGARRSKAGVISADSIQTSVAGSESAPKEMLGESGNEGGEGNPTKDFQIFLDREEEMMKKGITELKNRDDFNSPHWLHILRDGTRVFVDMTDENGLKGIYDELSEEGKTLKARQLQSQWIEANHRLEMIYLKQRLIIEILAVGAEAMDRINSSSQKSVLRSIGRIIRHGVSNERIFIPSDPGESKHDPSGTEGIREAIQDMISIWREERVPKENKGNNFEAYFKREFSQIIDQSNKQIKDFFEKKWAELTSKEAPHGEPGKARQSRKKKEQPTSKSTELVDMIALEQSALQSAERYFTDEAIPIIEETMRDAGVDLIWLLSEGEENERVLDFVLKEVGVNIVTLASRYTGQLAEEKRAAFEQKIRDAAKNILTELIIGKISRMLESKSSGR